jgi:hypothetical protein
MIRASGLGMERYIAGTGYSFAWLPIFMKCIERKGTMIVRTSKVQRLGGTEAKVDYESRVGGGCRLHLA